MTKLENLRQVETKKPIMFMLPKEKTSTLLSKDIEIEKQLDRSYNLKRVRNKNDLLEMKEFFKNNISLHINEVSLSSGNCYIYKIEKGNEVFDYLSARRVIDLSTNECKPYFQVYAHFSPHLTSDFEAYEVALEKVKNNAKKLECSHILLNLTCDGSLEKAFLSSHGYKAAYNYFWKNLNIATIEPNKSLDIEFKEIQYDDRSETNQLIRLYEELMFDNTIDKKKFDLKLKNEMKIDPSFKIMGIWNSRNLIGTLSYWEMCNPKEKSLLIENIIVKNEFQHKGIGKRSMKEMFNIAKEKDCDIICLNSQLAREESAYSFYEKLGFSRKLIYKLELENT